MCAILAFVACGDPAVLDGTLEVTTQTRGEQADEDGYDLWIDGELEASLGPNETTSVDLPEGLRVVELQGIAPTCAVDGDNPATTSVYNSAPRELTFRVECGPGTLSVSTTVSGDGAAPSGLEVLVNGGPSGSVAVGAPLSVRLDPGVYEVQLTGVPERCTLSGTNPRSATVTHNATTSVAFSLSCTGTAVQP